MSRPADRDMARWLSRGWGLAVALCALTALAAPALAGPRRRHHHHHRARRASGVSVFLVSNQGPDITPQQCNAMGGCGPTVSAPLVLAKGKRYVIEVQGTISVWDQWSSPVCGHPEPRPEFPTPGRVTPTGDDAQFRFAIHRHGTICDRLPLKQNLFQFNLGSGWYHPIANGNPSKPPPDIGTIQHPYKFTVVGQGSRPSFRYIDYHPSDNDGELKITVELVLPGRGLGQARMWLTR